MSSNEAETVAPVRRVLAEDADFGGDRQFATTLARGLALLKCFTPARPTLSNRELSDQTGLPKATISRLTYTLCALGYLRNVPDSQRYALGSAVVSLAYPLLANVGLRQAARAPMHELSASVRGSVSLAIRDRLDMVFIEVSRSRSAFSARIADIGLSYPIAATAIGWAYLAACPATERQALIHEIRLRQPALWAQYEPNIRANLNFYASAGFCANHGELRPEVAAVAAPFDTTPEGRQLIFNCVVPTFRCSREDLVHDIGPRLVNMLRSLRPAG